MRSVACVGAGTIGAGWAVVFARAGLEVRLYDPDPARLRDIPDGVTAAGELPDALDGVGYVQESVPERLGVKRAVFAELDELAPPDVVLASSASALPMTEIAAGLRHPERCLVVHPFNPPYALPLVEIVPGAATDPALPEQVRAFVESVGQRPIVCRREIFGFVGNRLQMALLREALYLHREGIASVEDIDRCLTDGLGLRWALLGPFGVEHTNAESIADGLRKFGQPIRDIFASLYDGSDLLADADVDAIAVEVEQAFAGRPHDELTSWRDRKLIALREVRDA
ncbi:MAG: 3-hydroxyacyl-CoA dehydrogenase NAD-binding domain-containing protein [Gaiellaceae bacterium]